jgi:hypothetical protein
MDELTVISGTSAKQHGFDLDLDFSNGSVPQLTGRPAEYLRAYIACYTKKGSIPFQADKGIDWVAFKQGKTPFNEIIHDLNQRIAIYVGVGKYAPAFKQVDRLLQFRLLELT